MTFDNWDRVDTIFSGIFLLAAVLYFGVLLTSGERNLLFVPLCVQVLIGVAWVGKHTVDR